MSVVITIVIDIYRHSRTKFMAIVILIIFGKVTANPIVLSGILEDTLKIDQL